SRSRARRRIWRRAPRSARRAVRTTAASTHDEEERGGSEDSGSSPGGIIALMIRNDRNKIDRLFCSTEAGEGGFAGGTTRPGLGGRLERRGVVLGRALHVGRLPQLGPLTKRRDEQRIRCDRFREVLDCARHIPLVPPH